MTDCNPSSQDRDPTYGWVMVFAVFLLSALAFGALGSISVFSSPWLQNLVGAMAKLLWAIRLYLFLRRCSAFSGGTSQTAEVHGGSAWWLHLPCLAVCSH